MPIFIPNFPRMLSFPPLAVVRTVLAGAFLALPAGMHAQWGRPTAVQRVIAEHWRTVPADSASLTALRAASREVGGGTIVRAAIDAARSPDRPFEVRFAALMLLDHAVRPRSGVPEDELRRVADAPDPVCEPSPAWAPGDTLRVCHDLTRAMVFGFVSHPDYDLASSIEPPLRDTIRAVLRTLADSDPDRRIQRITGPLASAAGQADDPLGLRPCPMPAGESGACRGSPLPPAALRWTTIGPGASLDTLLRGSQEVRDRRLQALLKKVALDRSRPSLVRRAAMEALATLAHPMMKTLDLRAWEKLDPWGREASDCVSWGWHAHHAVQSEGAVSMRPGSRFDVAVFLERIGRSKEAPEIRKQGARLAQCLWSLFPQHPTPGP
jgi:hypothetical protein